MAPKGERPPRVSIGFPVRNGGHLLVEALRSVQNQTEGDIEILISDNASDDGSRGFLEAAAVADPRISYFRQKPAIRAYDNFHFVLRQARGEYFMWAAHDDTRDADFVARMVSALQKTPAAVLAFGDLNIVTPENPGGRIRRFPFQTQGMGPRARLRKLSRMQCYYIYGVWRTAAIRSVPYAYCAWWPDLPMMLAAAVLGPFIHVPGSRLHYLEIPKSNLHRVKNQDLTARFSLPLGVAGLIGATYGACASVGGPWIGAYSAALVLLKQAINLPGFLVRRLRRPPVPLWK
jgi:glycosyltransferase involved in cell wall biosynthesis